MRTYFSINYAVLQRVYLTLVRNVNKLWHDISDPISIFQCLQVDKKMVEYF